MVQELQIRSRLNGSAYYWLLAGSTQAVADPGRSNREKILRNRTSTIEQRTKWDLILSELSTVIARRDGQYGCPRFAVECGMDSVSHRRSNRTFIASIDHNFVRSTGVVMQFGFDSTAQ